MGVIAELFSDEQGLVWPENIAPFSLYLINIGDSAGIRETTRSVYDRLTASGVEVLWDDRDARPGDKFADGDLMGIPHRVVVSPQTVAGNKLEYKGRTERKAVELSVDQLMEKLIHKGI